VAQIDELFTARFDRDSLQPSRVCRATRRATSPVRAAGLGACLPGPGARGCLNASPADPLAIHDITNDEGRVMDFCDDCSAAGPAGARIRADR
jgi:hypothetical protein